MRGLRRVGITSIEQLIITYPTGFLDSIRLKRGDDSVI